MPDNTTFVAAATAAPPVLENGASQLNTVEEPLDVLVPFVYHRSLPHLVRPVCGVSVEYYSSTRPDEAHAALAGSPWNSAGLDARTAIGGLSTVTYSPALQPHRAEVEAALSSSAFPGGSGSARSPMSAFSFAGGAGGGGDETGERKNVKQGFLETLLNGGGAEGTAASGAEGNAAPFASDVRTRLHDDVCDASYVRQIALLVHLVEMVAASRAHAGRLGVKCVTTIDLSHTDLGLVGHDMPPTAFDANGESLPLARGDEHGGTVRNREEGTAGETAGVAVASGDEGAREDALRTADAALLWTLPLRFFPEEAEPRSATPKRVLDTIAERHLSLCYVAPLLYQPSGMSYRIEVLTCAHCNLNDNDAKALAHIVAHKFTSRFECHLRSLDLSHNAITNSGARSLSHALKLNRLVTKLDLDENPGVTDAHILSTLEKRLKRNRDGKSNLAWYEKPKRWFR